MSNDQSHDQVYSAINAINENTVDTTQLAISLSPTAVNSDLHLINPNTITTVDSTKSDESHVSGLIGTLLARDFKDPTVALDTKSMMEHFQNTTLQDAVFTSEKLQEPMMKIAGTVEGNELMDALTDLDITMRGLHPKEHNIEGNFLQNLIASILPAFKPVRKYFMMLQSQQSVLASMKDMVNKGIEEREKDGRILEHDKLSLTKCAHALEKSIRIGVLMDEKLEYTIEREVNDEDHKQFLQSEVLFTLRQTVRSLQEQLAVTNQGIMAMELLLRLNRETVNSGRRTLNVSMHALSIAGVLATVMAGMKDFNEKIGAMKQTANDFIAFNGDMLEQTATEVGELARSTTLDIEVLETAFDKIHNAYENELNMRVEALSGMKVEMTRLTDMNAKSQSQISRMERGRNAADAIEGELEHSEIQANS